MKAKIIINPAAKWIIHHDIDQEVRKDAAFIESAAVNSVVYVLRLGGYKPVSKKNIAVFAGEFYQKANRFLQIDPYKWPEYMKEQCEMRKLSYDDEWEKLRDREGDQPAGNWHILPKKARSKAIISKRKTWKKVISPAVCSALRHLQRWTRWDIPQKRHRTFSTKP